MELAVAIADTLLHIFLLKMVNFDYMVNLCFCKKCRMTLSLSITELLWYTLARERLADLICSQ